MMRRAEWLLALPALLFLGSSLLMAQDEASLNELIEGTIAGVKRQKVIETKYDEIMARGAAAVAPVRDKMLSENDEGVRVAGAMILAKIAEATDSETLLQALRQCWEDSSAGVNFWGLKGLLIHKKVPRNFMEDLTIQSLNMKRSYPVRVIGCRTSGERKVVKAVPWLVEILRVNAADFTKAKDEIFVEEIEVEKRVTPEEMGPGAPGAPGEPEIPGAVEPPPPVRRPMRRPGRRPAPGMPEEPMMEEGMVTTRVVIEEKPIDPEKTRPRIMEKAANELELHPAVMEIRAAGVALERLTRQQFGFSGGPTWELGESIVKARAWFEVNRTRYPGGPPPPAEEKEEEEAERSPRMREPVRPAPPAAPAPAG